jgi:ferredoxin-NADP reductase
MMMAGIVAAHETTANATANALKLLLQHPQAWRDICDDPSLIPNAVEECLRHNGSVAAWRRLATKDVKIGGIDIPAGSKLLIVTSSANHDQHQFADADLFDIRRENASDQLTFGYGAHQCMGKNLARMEMQIFLDELTRRLPHMRLAEQRFTYVPNTSFRGPEHLYVEWDPAMNPERADPNVREARAVVRIGEPSSHAVSRAVIVDSVQACADRVVRVRLVSADGRDLPRWTAGSHIDVVCGETGLSRQYSLCGDPDDAGAFEIAVLREAESRGGSAWVHENVKRGAHWRIRGPRNHFRLDERAKKLVLIAGGIGITPISAMARRARSLGIDYEVHYSGRSRASMALLDEMRALHGARLREYVSEEGTRNDFAALAVEEGTLVYACGPARMLDALGEASASWPEEALKIEHFESKLGTLDPQHERAFEVELKDSGLVLTVPADQTLLTTLRRANVDVQSDCEEGLCGSCEVRVLQGEIDHRDVVLTKGERQSNDRMMACCSRAKGRKLVLAL